MKRRTAAWRHDQATSRSAGEVRDAAFDLASVAHADGVHLHPERLRCGLDGAELTDPGRTVGIPKDSCSRHTRRDLLEELQPFPAPTGFINHKAGGVAPRPGQVI